MDWRQLTTSCIKIGVSLLVSCLFILALGLSVARYMLPQVDAHKDELASWLSGVVHETITIKSVSASWFHFTPYLRFQDVTIGEATATAKPIHIKQFDVAISIWHSVLALAPRPGKLILKGAHLNITQDGKRFVIAGIKPPASSSNGSSKVFISELVAWLIKQTDISVSAVSINLQLADKRTFAIKNIELHSFGRGNDHRLVFSSDLHHDKTASFKLVADIKNAATSDKYDVNFFGEIGNLALTQPQEIINNIMPVDLAVTAGTFSGKFWGNMTANKLTSLHTIFDMDKVAAQYKGKALPKLSLHHANMLWEREGTNWHVAADDLRGTLDNEQLANLQFGFKYTAQVVQKYHLILNNLPIGPSWQLIKSHQDLLPAAFTKYSMLQPQGIIQSLNLAWGANFSQTWRADLTGKNLKIAHVLRANEKGVGSVYGPLQVSVSGDSTHGVANISGNKVETLISAIYNHSLRWDSLAATAAWQHSVTGTTIKISDMKLSAPSLIINGAGKLDLPQTGDAQIDLQAAAKLAAATEVAKYIPDHHLSAKAGGWLRHAFVAGQVPEATMVLRGPLHKFPYFAKSGHFEVNAKVANVTLRYQNNWPLITNINGEMHFMDQGLVIDGTTGLTKGLRINSFKAKIPNLKQSVLALSGTGYGDVADGMQFLRNTPLKVGKELSPVKAAGAMNMQLNLLFPLYKHMEGSTVYGVINAKNASWLMPDWAVDIDRANGKISFTQNSLHAANIRARMLNAPTRINVNTLHSGALDVTATGKAGIKDIRKQYQIPLLGFARGIMPYTAKLRIYPDGKGKGYLQINSNLQGVAIDLPGDLAKSYQAKTDLSLNMSLASSNYFPITLTYNSFVKAQLGIGINNKNVLLRQALIQIGRIDNKLSMQANKLVVRARMRKVKLSEWQQVYAKYLQLTQTKGKNAASNGSPVLNMQIFAKRWYIKKMRITNMQLGINEIKHGWRVLVYHKLMQGAVNWLQQGKKKTLSGHFVKFYWQPESDNAQAAKKVNVTSFPNLNISCDDCKFGKYAFKDFSIKAKQSINGYKIQDLSLRPRYSVVDVQGNISKSGVVKVKGTAQTQDLGAWLRAWQLNKDLSGGTGSSSYSASWNSGVFTPKLANLQLKGSMHLEDGRILDIGQAAQNKLGFGRLLNIFSLQSLPRRLALNFTDLNKKGFHFNSIDTQLNLSHGVLNLQHAHVKGSVANIVAVGMLNLLNKTCDINIEIEPKVTSSAPFIAAIAGGPVVGAIAWVANKVVSPTLSKAFLVRYRVSGSINKPVISELKKYKKQQAQLPAPN